MHLSTNGTFIQINPQNFDDLKFLANFPGFHDNKCPAEKEIGKDLITRLVERKVPFTFDPEVKKIITIEPQRFIPESFHFHTQPLPFQELAIKTAAQRNNIGFLLDPGLGKTKVTLDWLFLKKAERIVCICPSPLKNVWVNEIAKHRPEFRPYIIQTTILTDELEAADAANANFLICSYRIASDGAGFLANWKPDALVVDEALIKNPSSLRTISLTQLSKTESVKYRAILSGTLINNHPGEVFAPVRFLEPSLFGTRKTVFDKEYYHFSKSADKKFPVALKSGVEAELRKTLRSCSIIMRKEEYLSSLPPKEFHPIFVPVEPKQAQLIEDVRTKGKFVFQGRKPIITTNTLATIGKLLQLENSFYYEPLEDNDLSLEELFFSEEKKKGPAKVEIVYLHPKTLLHETPKAKQLQKLAKELGKKRGIIWYNFKAELPIIKAALDKLEDPYLVVDGMTKNPGDVVDQFNDNPDFRWLVAQARVLNYGVTILGSEPSEEKLLPKFDSKVHVEIFMSLNFSYEILIQQQDRIHRIGQENTCEYYYLLADSQGERRVWEILGNKENVREFMLASCLGSGDLDG